MYRLVRMRGISDIPVKNSATVTIRFVTQGEHTTQAPYFRNGSKHAIKLIPGGMTLLGMTLAAGKLCNPYNRAVLA